MIRDYEIVRFAPFQFMKRRKKTNNVLMRLSIILMLPIFILLIIGLPFNYFITGNWGYCPEDLKWYSKWVTNCGF